MAQSINHSFVTIRRALLLLAVLLVAGCASPAERAQSYYERGMKLMSQQEYVKASIEFKNALQLKKDLVDAWRGLAQIEERNQNWEGLTSIQRTIVELDPKDIDAKLRLARLMALGNALDEALDLVNAAGELDERHAGVLVTKAVILFRLNDIRGAVREAREALEIDPANVEAMLVLAADRLARGDNEGALLILDREAVAHTKNLGVQLFKIKISEQMGNAQEVEAVLHKLIELYPQQSDFRRQLVKRYLDEKRPDEAEKVLRALAAANPADVKAELELVRFLRSVKGPDAARQELATRINAGGQVFHYQIALAQFDFAQGHVTDSIQLLEKLADNADSREHALTAQAKLAEIHLSNKNFDAAEAVVTEILRKDNRNTDGLKLRASIRLQRGELDAAIADARQALNDQPRSTELSLLLAAAYERSGSIELTEKQYAELTKASGFHPTAGLNYVAFLRRRGQIARAEDMLTELANRWPNNVSILSALADVRLARKNWIGAEQIAEAIRRIGDNRGLADQIMGAVLSGRNRYDESISVLQNAYATNPAVQPMSALVRTLVRAQKLDRAMAFLQTVLEANPANAEAYVLLGSIQLLKNAPDQALKSFRAAIEQQPKNIEGYRALADFYLTQKDNDEALKIIGAGLKEQPDSFALRLALAGIFEVKGDYEAAIAELESMLKQQPGSMIVANNLASLLADHRTDKASLERAYSLAIMLQKSQVSPFKDTLGWIYYHRGDYKNAISLLEEAAAELPRVADVRYHLGMSYIATGELAKAAEQLKTARELAPNNSTLEAKIKAALEKAAM
jgi:tetratricopeptide (TPR) repeat protein